MATTTTSQFHSREDAREKLIAKIKHQNEILRDPHAFSTIDPHYLIDDALFRLRWIDCAPEGANHIVAPMQGKSGIPCDSYNDREDVGPNQALREARIRHGRNPFSGEVQA